LLDRLFDADVRLVAGKAERRAAMARIGDELRANGETPYVVPTGGSVPLGAAAYVAATLELARQLHDVGEAPRRLYVATGSQGTQSGLVVGRRAYSMSYEVRGVAVEYPRDELVASCVELANGTADLLGLAACFDAADVSIDDGFVGEAYGKPTAGGLEAIRLLARTEAVVLDPVYSGKAMAGLIAHVRAGAFDPDESVVFLHTGGGPSIFPFGETLLGD
jgi:1-aminocyclopropane-1-carboxylate deaminase/D-cysteine desulfhydrase-like pyridoxal-dependent ACC family enzyme